MNRPTAAPPRCSPRATRTVVLLAVAGLLATACSPSRDRAFEVTGGSQATAGLNGTDVGDVIPRPAMVLPDTTGMPFDLGARPAGELTVLFFGYTNCPDLCPTTMADLTSARRALNPAVRDKVRVAFVSEDPARDTPPVLRAWLDRFDTGYPGLLGGNDTSREALDALKAPRTDVVTTPTDGPTGAGAVVEHTGSVYVFYRDKVVVYTGGTTPTQYADDFRALLAAT